MARRAARATRRLTLSGDQSDTLAALLDTAERLWPAPARCDVDGALEPGHTVVREFLLLPSRRQPSLALPTAGAGVAAAALRKYSQGVGRVERLARTVASGALRVPGVHATLRRVAPDRLRVSAPTDPPVDSIERHLGEILGEEEVVVSLTVGPPRANRKPILQVLRPDGQTLAFVKVGTSAVSQALVRGEADALTELWSVGRPPERLRFPRVLDHGQWRGLDILVLTPVHPTSPRWRRQAVPTAAMRELAGWLGTSRRALATSEAWKLAQATPAELADPVLAAEFDRIVVAAGERYGDVELTLGSWHGDWTPWNMAWDGARVLLWDFERFATGVPVGFDLVHYTLQVVLRDRGEEAAAGVVRAWLAEGRADDLTNARTTRARRRVVGGEAPGPAPSHHLASASDEPDDPWAGNDVPAVVVAYLTELARRYVVASEPPEGAPLRARTRWLLDLLHEVVVRP